MFEWENSFLATNGILDFFFGRAITIPIISELSFDSPLINTFSKRSEVNKNFSKASPIVNNFSKKSIIP